MGTVPASKHFSRAIKQPVFNALVTTWTQAYEISELICRYIITVKGSVWFDVVNMYNRILSFYFVAYLASVIISRSRQVSLYTPISASVGTNSTLKQWMQHTASLSLMYRETFTRTILSTSARLIFKRFTTNLACSYDALHTLVTIDFVRAFMGTIFPMRSLDYVKLNTALSAYNNLSSYIVLTFTRTINSVLFTAIKYPVTCFTFMGVALIEAIARTIGSAVYVTGLFIKGDGIAANGASLSRHSVYPYANIRLQSRQVGGYVPLFEDQSSLLNHSIIADRGMLCQI